MPETVSAREPSRETPALGRAPDPLTPREREVLTLMGGGPLQCRTGAGPDGEAP